MNNKKITVIICLLFFAFISNSAFARRVSARDKACFSNIRVIQGAVEMYNMDKNEYMKTLDIDLLVESKYLEGKPYPPEVDCQYLSEGNLAEDGKIYCKHHGIILNSEEERKISEKEKSDEIKDSLKRKFLFLTICFIPSFIFLSYSLYFQKESLGCFLLMLIIMALLFTLPPVSLLVNRLL